MTGTLLLLTALAITLTLVGLPPLRRPTPTRRPSGNVGADLPNCPCPECLHRMWALPAVTPPHETTQ